MVVTNHVLYSNLLAFTHTGRLALRGVMHSVQLYNPNVYEIDVDMQNIALKMNAIMGKHDEALLGAVSGCTSDENPGDTQRWLPLAPESPTLACLAVDIDIVDISLVEQLIEQCQMNGRIVVEVFGPVSVRFPMPFHSAVTMRPHVRLFTFIQPCIS